MPKRLLLKSHKGAYGLGRYLIATVLGQGDDLPLLFEQVGQGFPDHAHACPMVNGAIIFVDSASFHDGLQRGGGAPLHAPHPSREEFCGIFRVLLEGGKGIHHVRILLAPPIPCGISNVETQYFKIGNEGVQGWNQTVCPTAVQLVGQGRRDTGHAVAVFMSGTK